MLAIGSQGLYRSRTCAVRAVETVRLGRAVAVATAVALLAANAMDLSIGIGAAIAAVAVTWFLLTATRGLYGAWLRKLRMQGRFCRQVVVVGTGDEGTALRWSSSTPSSGSGPGGGSCHSLASGTARSSGSASSPTPIWPSRRRERRDHRSERHLVRRAQHLTRLLEDGVHVHLEQSRGIDGRRLRSVPPPTSRSSTWAVSSLWQFREAGGDLILASLIFLVALPVLAVAALAVKLATAARCSSARSPARTARRSAC
jgi:hypothetical protein